MTARVLTRRSEAGEPLPDFYGIPQYYDMGLLLCRSDILAKYDIVVPPSLLGGPESEQSGGPQSMWQIVAQICRQSSCPGLAFDTTIVENLVCPFIELCWNCGAPPDFLWCPPRDKNNGKGPRERDPARTERARRFVLRALKFLGYMVFRRYMPYPCDSATAGQAVFCRHWFSTFQDMICGEPQMAGKHALMPFPVARLSEDERRRLEGDILRWAKASSCALEGFEELKGRNAAAEADKLKKVLRDRIVDVQGLDAYLRLAYALEVFEFVNGKWVAL